MNTNIAVPIDKKAVSNSFSKAAKHYDQFAQLQRDIGENLISQINNQHNSKILDLGCGTGYFTEKLHKHYPMSQITGFDLSQAMLQQVTNKGLQSVNVTQGDIDYLPFIRPSFDLIFSNLVLQWSENLTRCLLQLKEALHDGGKLYFSTLLNGSLNELTQAWKQVDNHPHTNDFVSYQTLQKQIHSIGFSHIFIETETRVLRYDTLIDLMRALKGIGANHVHGRQGTKVSGRKVLKLLEQGYQPYINKEGKFTLTYQVCYVEAQK